MDPHPHGLSLLLQWCIYLLSGFTILLSVAVFTLDIEHGGVNFLTDFLLFCGMAGSGASALFHYRHPRLVYICLMVLLSVVTFFASMCIRWNDFQWGLVSVLMVNTLLGSLYIALTYYTNDDKEKSIVGLMLENKSGDGDASPAGCKPNPARSAKSEVSSIVDAAKNDVEQSTIESTTGTKAESRDLSANTNPL